MKRIDPKMNSFGFSLAEVTIAVGVAGLVVLSAYGLATMMQRARSGLDVSEWMSAYRLQLVKTLKDDRAWARTLDANGPAFDCVTNAEPCLGRGSAIELRDSQDLALGFVARPADPTTKGLTSTGQICWSFSPSGADPTCPFRYEARWDPVCQDAACRKYSVQASARLLIAEGPWKSKLNPESYSAVFLRGDSRPDVSDVCASVGGAYDPATKTCNVAVNAICPPRWFVVGFTNSGGTMCAQHDSFRCPAGQIMAGLAADGSIRCEPGCDPDSGSSAGSWGTTYTGTTVR